MKKYFVFIVCLFFVFTKQLLAQQKSNYQWVIVPQFNILNGQQITSTSIHLNTGIANNKNQYTIGVGIDYYIYRTVPIIAEYKHFIGNKKNKQFVYAGLGYNVAWLFDSQKKQTWNWGSPSTFADYSNGFTYQFGIGYAVLIKNKKGVLFNLGFSNKSLTENTSSWVFNGTNSVLMPSSKKFDLNRLAIGIAYIL